ncbi:hypothetical protein Gorai_024089, partial [Gossypium raimondii]|nr:hypothetical protein [Gossypium raimondii]
MVIGSCLSEFDKKDLFHAIGVTFGGVIKSEINGDLCRLRIKLDLQKPLLREDENAMVWSLQDKIQPTGLEKVEKKQEEGSAIKKIESNEDIIMRKRKSAELETEECCTGNPYEDGPKRMKHERKDIQIEASLVVSVGNSKQICDPHFYGSVGAKRSPRAVWRLRHLLNLYNLQMVFLMEKIIDEKRMEKVRRRCGFMNGINVEVKGSRGGLCLAWKGDITISLRSFSKSHIDVMIKEENVNEEWRFIRFYGSSYVNNKN